MEKEKGMEDICLINKNEIAFYAKQKGKIYGKNEYVYFYDIQNNQKFKKFKVGNGQMNHELLLINKDKLLFERDESILLFDVNNRIKLNEFKIFLILYQILLLNDNTFLYEDEPLQQYELIDPKTIEMKEEKEIEYYLISKYYENKIIIYNDKKITLLG